MVSYRFEEERERGPPRIRDGPLVKGAPLGWGCAVAALTQAAGGAAGVVPHLQQLRQAGCRLAAAHLHLPRPRPLPRCTAAPPTHSPPLPDGECEEVYSVYHVQALGSTEREW